MFLKTFCVPILPYMLEFRLGKDGQLLQTMTVWLLAEDAAITLILSGPIGHFVDHSNSKRGWLLAGLVVASASTLGMALATSSKFHFQSFQICSKSHVSRHTLRKPRNTSSFQHNHVGRGIFSYRGYHSNGSAGENIRMGLDGFVRWHIHGSHDFRDSIAFRGLLGCMVKRLCLSHHRYNPQAVDARRVQQAERIRYGFSMLSSS